MMKALHWFVIFSWTSIGAAAWSGDLEEESSVQRGSKAARTVTSPLTSSLAAYKGLWRSWGLKDRPDDFEQQVLERYGLHEALYDNKKLPMGLHEIDGPLGKALGNDCLMCHAGRIAGQTIIGLGNASFDFQSFYDDLMAVDPIPLRLPFKLSNGRGIIEATGSTIFLLQLRDANLNLTIPRKLTYRDDLCQDIPAWWHRKRKKTMFHLGQTDVRSTRANLSFLLAPTNSGTFIKKQEPVFDDIKAYVFSLEAPKYPFKIDKQLATKGERIFRDQCARCHGTYGPDGRYPNKVISVEDVGTDPSLATFHPKEDTDYYVKSWLFNEKSPDGELYSKELFAGYQAPPLDGIWATAPYFHNGSVPTVYHVLNSKSRPAIYTRSYRAEKDDYDQSKLGLKITTLEKVPDGAKPYERRKICDSSQTGRGNGGHTFGDKLTDDERTAVVEYLKSL